MENAYFIARLLSIVFLALGLGILVSPKYYLNEYAAMIKKGGNGYLAAILSLCAGFAIVSIHNVWAGWATLITLVGYSALLKGFLLLIFPTQMREWSMKMIDEKYFSLYGGLVIAVGLLFGYFGFIA